MDFRFLLYLMFLFCANALFAQKRTFIDRTGQKKEQKVSTSSSKSNTSSKPSTNHTVQTKEQKNSNNSTKSQSSTKSRKAKKSSQSSFFRISSEYAYFDYRGGTEIFTISSSRPWNISTYPYSWGHLTRNGNKLTLDVDANTGSSSRSDYFCISSGSKTIRINISQTKGQFLNVSSEKLYFSESGGSQTITITASDSWKIGTGTYDWAHLSIRGNQLTVLLDANTNSTQRTDYFTIVQGDLVKRVYLVQEGKSSSFVKKSAVLKNVSVYSSARVEGRAGIRIHVDLDISGMKGRDVKVSCYFYDSNGNALLNTNGYYGTVGTPSYVAAGTDIKPSYDNSSYPDLQIEIPDKELHLYGTYSRTLLVSVIVWDCSNVKPEAITRKDNISFTCTPNY